MKCIYEKPEIAYPEISEKRSKKNLSWIEIGSENYHNNIRTISSLFPENVEISVLLNANAYGHGWRQIAELATAAGVKYFSVFIVDEMVEVWGFLPDAELFVLGPVPE